MITGIEVISVNGGKLSTKQAIFRSGFDLLLALISLFYITHSFLQTSDQEFMAMSWTQRLEIHNEVDESVLISWIETIWFWSEIVTAMFNKQRRAVHDFISGSIVVVKN